MIRVLIADDHAIVRHGLRLILESAGDFEVVAEAEDGNQALEQTAQQPVDVLLLDVAMHTVGALEVLQRLHRERRPLPCLILSMYPPEQYALRLLKAGAAGYLTKEAAPRQLVAAVRQVATGKRYITPEVGELLAESLGGTATVPHQRLSEREYQVMCQLAAGRTPTQIAESMNLSVQTVSTYRSRVLSKMHLKSNAELTYYAVKHGLIE